MKRGVLLRNVARTILLILTTVLFLFGLLSGSEKYGGGLYGVLMNSPNAVPWLLLFALVYVVWNYEEVGGWLLIGCGVVTMFFFNTFKEPIVLFIITIPLLLLGCCFLVAAKRTKTKQKQKHK